MSPSFRRVAIPVPAIAGDGGFRPPEIHRIEDVDVVVVCGPVAAAEDDELLADGGTGHCAQGDGNFAADFGDREVEGVCVKDIEFIEAGLGGTAPEDVDGGTD